VGKRIYATTLVGFDGDDIAEPTLRQSSELEACRLSSRRFLRCSQFRNRDTGEIGSSVALWPGQERFADLMEREPRICALKAGKLGFTEPECAYDSWVVLFRQPNARGHFASREGSVQ